MILESYDWKKELKRYINEFSKDLSNRIKYSETIRVKIELFFFITCFIVRKISESNKLSDEIESSLIPTKRYKNIKKFHTYLDRYEIDKHFDLNKPIKNNLEIKNLLNFGIHSHSFVYSFNATNDLQKLDFSIYINSDRTKNTELCEIHIKDYIKFLSKVANDQIVSSLMIYDKKAREMKYVNKSNKAKSFD